METIKLALPAGKTEELRTVSIWGERRLQGFADTGVFSIATFGQKDADDQPKTNRCGDDGLAFASIGFAGNLDFASNDHGDDPYDRDS
ncbi:MAG: hypothetical protein O6700_09660 [Gammaproteobacteria bacterium]|nr:hypothetical protein [Gammaproteobacteria bacterium]